MKKNLIITALALALGATTVFAADKSEEKKSDYPLKKCVVTDEDLGSMGKPFVFKHEGREVQLCCESCKKDFNKSPAKYVKKIEDAEKKAGKKK